MLRLYYAECETLDTAGDDSLFSVYRREKLAQVRAPELRKQMTAAELLLMRAVKEAGVGAAFPLRIQTDLFGKPFLPDLPLYFSLSHSGRRVCCALSDRDIGFDVQKISRPHDALLRRCLSERERSRICESANPAAAFTLLWCVKESYVKATGEGLSRALETLELSLERPLRVRGDYRARFWTWEEPAYQASLCTLDGSDPQPERIEKLELGR